MKVFVSLISILAVSFILNGCNSDDKTAAPATPTDPVVLATSPACTISVNDGETTTVTCLLYTAATPQYAINAACAGAAQTEGVTGTTSATCPASNRLGTCSFPNHATMASTTYYAGGVYTSDSAASACASSSGTYAPGI